MPECSCERIQEIADEMVQQIRELIEQIPTSQPSEGKKKKRAPSAYNEFIGSCMKSGSDMKTCAAKYKEQKS